MVSAAQKPRPTSQDPPAAKAPRRAVPSALIQEHLFSDSDEERAPRRRAPCGGALRKPDPRSGCLNRITCRRGLRSRRRRHGRVRRGRGRGRSRCARSVRKRTLTQRSTRTTSDPPARGRAPSRRRPVRRVPGAQRVDLQRAAPGHRSGVLRAVVPQFSRVHPALTAANTAKGGSSGHTVITPGVRRAKGSGGSNRWQSR